MLAPLVAASRSMSELLIALELRQSGGNYVHIRTLIVNFGLSSDHWVGQGWAKGRTKDSDSSVARFTASHTFLDEEIFVQNGPSISGTKIMKRLLASGREYKCSTCPNRGRRRNGSLILEIHHLNGIHNDNRYENLQILCPNCHQQADRLNKLARIQKAA